MTFEARGNPTSLPGSAAGPTRSGSPGGTTIDPSGPAHVHVSRFRAQDSGKAMSTNDTSGPLFTASSPSARLQWSLESRLQALMAGNGSPLFVLTWRRVDMPSGPPICRLLARARRIQGSDTSLWATVAGPTPTAVTGTGGIALCKWGGSRTRALLKQHLTTKEINGPLNPNLPRWLMGFPPEWSNAAPTATPSSRKSRQRL
jgi:hypothetical protein